MFYAIFGIITMLLVLGVTIHDAFANFWHWDHRKEPSNKPVFILMGTVLAILSLYIWPILWAVWLWRQRYAFKTTFDEFKKFFSLLS